MQRAIIAAIMGIAMVSCTATPPTAPGRTISATIDVSPFIASFGAAVDSAGFRPLLDSVGPYTVFAPVNAAFTSLPLGTMPGLFEGGNTPALRQFILSHVVPGAYLDADLAHTQTLTTLGGTQIQILYIDGIKTVDGVAFVAKDIIASNGVMHFMERVLRSSLDSSARFEFIAARP